MGCYYLKPHTKPVYILNIRTSPTGDNVTSVSTTTQSNILNSYYIQIPSNTFDSTIQSALLSGVISTLFRGSVSLGLRSAVWGATTTVIYALISPIFTYVIGSNRLLTQSEEALRGCIAYIGTGILDLALTGNNAAIKIVWIYALRHLIPTAKAEYNTKIKTRNLNHTNIMPFF